MVPHQAGLDPIRNKTIATLVNLLITRSLNKLFLKYITNNNTLFSINSKNCIFEFIIQICQITFLPAAQITIIILQLLLFSDFFLFSAIPIFFIIPIFIIPIFSAIPILFAIPIFFVISIFSVVPIFFAVTILFAALIFFAILIFSDFSISLDILLPNMLSYFTELFRFHCKPFFSLQ